MSERRPSATRRGYGETWRRFRRWYLKLHPVCAHCGRGASEVDHIVPLSEGGAHLDPGNSQALCKGCHSRKTRAEQDGGKLKGCRADGTPIDAGHWWHE